MTNRPKTLIQSVYLALLLVLIPEIALSQDQSAPSAPQSEKAVQEPVSQKPGSLITPDQEKQESAAAPKQSGEEAAPAAAPAAAQPMPAAQEPSSYVIRRGDTLWDISNTMYKDPFLWPFIWKANPNITNPDLIYPGNKLAIPSMAPIERALQAPPKEVEKPVAKKEAVEESKPYAGIAAAQATKPKPVEPETAESPESRLILPEEQPVPIMDKYAMLSAGFVNQEEGADRIIGSREELKKFLSYDDIVYVKFRNPDQVKTGDKFLVYTVINKVKHPKTGKIVGNLIRGVGVVQITAKDAPEVFTGRITLSFGEIVKTSLLTPYQEPALVYNQKEKRTKDISGYIVEVTDERTINGQTDFVYLDQGSAEGVEAGDKFTVYAEHEDRQLPKMNIGEVLVFLVKEHTSTAVVKNSNLEMKRGNQIEFKKQ